MIATLDWNGPAVLFVCFLAFIGNYGCVALLEQYRLAINEYKKSTLLGKKVILILMFGLFGGVSIAGTNLFGILNVKIRSQDAYNLSVRIDIRYMLGAASLLVASSVCAMCVGVRVFHQSSKQKHQNEGVNAIESFIKGAKTDFASADAADSTGKLTTPVKAKVKRTHSNDMNLLTSGSAYICGAALLIGCGLTVSTYLLLSSLTVVGYNVQLRAVPAALAGFIISTTFEGIIVLWLMFKILVLFPQNELVRVICVILMTIPVAGNFFIGSKTFRLDIASQDSHDYPLYSVDAAYLSRCFLTTAVVAVTVSLMLAIANMRTWYQRLAMLVKEAEATYVDANNGSPSSKMMSIAVYEELRNTRGTKTDVEKVQKKRRSKNSVVGDSPRLLQELMNATPARRHTDPGSPSPSLEATPSNGNSPDDRFTVVVSSSPATPRVGVRAMAPSSLFTENIDPLKSRSDEFSDITESMKKTIKQTTLADGTATTADTSNTGLTASSRGSSKSPRNRTMYGVDEPNIVKTRYGMPVAAGPHWINDITARVLVQQQQQPSPQSPHGSPPESPRLRKPRRNPDARVDSSLPGNYEIDGTNYEDFESDGHANSPKPVVVGSSRSFTRPRSYSLNSVRIRHTFGTSQTEVDVDVL
jgi:hypothetical protein